MAERSKQGKQAAAQLESNAAGAEEPKEEPAESESGTSKARSSEDPLVAIRNEDVKERMA